MFSLLVPLYRGVLFEVHNTDNLHTLGLLDLFSCNPWRIWVSLCTVFV